MNSIKILWVDDEIDLLRIHILFLEEKGHQVATANNADDALDMLKAQSFDIMFLDENMPGKSGLDIISDIKKIRPALPIVMVTKNEDESAMDEAIGSGISDYIIKPVNPKQILLAIKKHVEQSGLITQKTTSDYQREFAELSGLITAARTYTDWYHVYKQLVHWELKLEASEGKTMDEVMKMQKEEASASFAKFIKHEYVAWMHPSATNRPEMPFDFFRKRIFPLTDNGEKICVLMIDNFRLDQWKTLEPLINKYMTTENEELSFSMLPTATQYARNAFFAGLTPLEISKRYPQFWLNDDEEGGKNQHEETLLNLLFERYRRKVKIGYEKVLNNKAGTKVNENITNLLDNQLMVVVYNFVDILSHARTEMKLIRELADDESAYRSLTLTWFEHSPLLELIKILAAEKIKTFITTDHGSVRISNAIKVIGDRETTTNLRYKQGRNLNYPRNKVFEITKPEDAGLPSATLSASYIFAQNNDFLAYPNNYNHYVNYYKDTFQHGGVSLEEMLLPMITLVPK